MTVHPTAIIDPSANLHESVEVGPFTIIEGNVTIDAGTKIASNVRIYRGTTLGKNNRIDHGCAIGCEPQHMAYDPAVETRLVIGAGNVLREGVNISRGYMAEGPGTVLGNENYLMAYVHLGHDVILKDNNIFASNTAVGGHVEIGKRAFISGLVGIHQFCKIGDFAMVGGSTKISMDIPPFTMVDGNPPVLTGINFIGMRRGGISQESRDRVKRAYKKVFRSGLPISKVMQELKDADPAPEVQYIIDFYEESERGVLDYRRIEDVAGV